MPSMKRRTLLIIDDHELFRAGIELIINQSFPMVTVRSHAGIGAALDTAELQPDVVLLDLNLDGVSGKQAFDMVRMRWPAASIVIVTSERNGAALDAIREDGSALIVSKAQPPHALVDLLRSRLDFAPKPANGQPFALTPRQMEVLQHVRMGYPNKTIARLMGLSEYTVRGHVQQIMRITGAGNRTQAALFAEQAIPV
ncbi:response regulator transcription factor [Sphingomonas sp. MMS24-J45]|uniref:response regulator transcription factor n=1 Tax=Sphingomonas sp. MMS24-J45 TaxID=3238806 RepID=UPI00384E0E56